MHRHQFLKTRRVLALGAFLAAVGLRPALGAEDIDIYAGVNAAGDRPNVLFILDSSANWSSNISVPNCYYRENGVLTATGPSSQGKKMGIEQCALHNLVDGLPVATSGGPDGNALYNIAFMLLPKTGGAYPRKAFTPLTTNNKATLKALVKSFDIIGDKGNNADFAKALYEAYLYYKGSPPYLGLQEAKRDPAAFAGGSYASPAAASCSRNYVILIANGEPQNSENNDAKTLLANAGGDVTPITYPSSVVKSSTQANWSDEFARFMHGADASSQAGAQGIITHAVAVTGASSDGTYPNFIRGIANEGGGSYQSASNADTLLAALLRIFNEIQAVDSVFASASLPVSVNARGTYLNQVYMGMFRPDGDAFPRWRGNLKQYKFALDELGALQLVDAVGNAAVSASTGFISPNAVSHWTTPSTFWSNQRLGTPPSESDSADGEVVEKGAAAQRLRIQHAASQTSRQVVTCVNCLAQTVLGSTSATKFDGENALITAGLLGVTSAERTPLINWVRGTDNAGDELGPTTSPATTIRPSVHGDVLHSRPAVVNYGGSTGAVVFYGANDGMLHAIDGNPTSAAGGNELWSFVPQEMFPKLNRLRTNTPEIRLPHTPASVSAAPRDYFVDGPIGVYQRMAADGAVEQVVLFVGMRRGGRLLYALDVTTPTAPRFLWKRSNSDLSALGQTWSEPKVARVRGNAGPVLIFGGGYDATAEDASTPGTTTMGNAVYVLDALSGAPLRSFPTTRSVPADVTLVDSDFDGYVDRAYAVDIGGKLSRVDFEADATHAPGTWSMYTVADLSGGTTTGRKFFFGPDAVTTRAFTALLLGSGDREKPLLSATQDHFFEVFDTNLGKAPLAGSTPITFGSLVAAGTESNTTVPGCYVALELGEKVVNAATSIGGVSYFGTNRPSSAASAQSCTANLGVAKSYAMPLFCVAPTGMVLAGGGLPPTPVSGVVSIGTGVTARQVAFVIGAPNAKRSGIEGSRVNPVIRVPRSRIYWYQEVNR